ncbi:MAG: Phosphoribosyl pyrophosphate synthase [Patescibacteria group bacterium]|nr:Phosphoribosyl pyrophosphate synthase [Patescibacteria group bacterium]
MKKPAASNAQLISGSAHPKLAQAVAKALKLPLTPIKLGAFANGEISCKLSQSVRGDYVFVLQSHCGDINKALLEQLIIIDTLKRASARSITAVCPFLAYARQDRKASGREPITARLVIDMLKAAGADRIMSIDLHSGQIQGFFDGPFDHLIARGILTNHITSKLDDGNLVIVSPDAGRVKSAERYASSLGCDIAIIHKHRSHEKANNVEAKHLIGKVEGKTCLIIDDMIDTAGTICAAADMLAENGAKKIYGLATHGVLSDPAVARIDASSFDKVIVTDSLPTPKSKKIQTITVAGLLASAIEAVYCGQSVSALFDGQNQF